MLVRESRLSAATTFGDFGPGRRRGAGRRHGGSDPAPGGHPDVGVQGDVQPAAGLGRGRAGPHQDH
eukprot:9053023-Lingulodinium_polyedra.AAC.1